MLQAKQTTSCSIKMFNCKNSCICPDFAQGAQSAQGSVCEKSCREQYTLINLRKMNFECN